jgi:hypothetical protein
MPDLWPWIALGCWCFGFTAGIAWAAQYRPTIIRIATRVEVEHDG